MRRWAILGIAFAMVVPACSALLDFSELDDGTGAACDAHCDAKDAVGATDAMEAVDATDALKDVAIEAAAPDGCNSKGGPRPVRWVGVTKEGMPQPLCIDSTEVTMSQYQDFLDALKAGATPSVAGACAFNESFAPATVENGCSATTFDPEGHPNYPVACVNWCDAYSFCEWAGKRLCHTVGGASMPYFQVVSSYDEWFGACSDNGANQFPWGGLDVDAGAGCNTTCRDLGATIAVASAPNCPTPNGVFDQSGNVSEWVDSCLGDASDSICTFEGDSFDRMTGPFCGACNAEDSHARSYAGIDVGIRCCGDSL